MGMNINNRGLFNFQQNWKDKIKYDPQYEGQELTAEPLKPESNNMKPLRPRPQVNIQEILGNLDNPNIPKFE